MRALIPLLQLADQLRSRRSIGWVLQPIVEFVRISRQVVKLAAAIVVARELVAGRTQHHRAVPPRRALRGEDRSFRIAFAAFPPAYERNSIEAVQLWQRQQLAQRGKHVHA